MNCTEAHGLLTVCGILGGALVGGFAGVAFGKLLAGPQYPPPSLHPPVRRMKLSERASLIRHGWMTPDGKWTDKGMTGNDHA